MSAPPFERFRVGTFGRQIIVTIPDNAMPEFSWHDLDKQADFIESAIEEKLAREKAKAGI